MICCCGSLLERGVSFLFLLEKTLNPGTFQAVYMVTSGECTHASCLQAT